LAPGDFDASLSGAGRMLVSAGVEDEELVLPESSLSARDSPLRAAGAFTPGDFDASESGTALEVGAPDGVSAA
jgi:hypothetical protein